MSDEEFADAPSVLLHPPTTKEYHLFVPSLEEHFVTGFENGDCAYATCRSASMAVNSGGGFVYPEWGKDAPRHFWSSGEERARGGG